MRHLFKTMGLFAVVATMLLLLASPAIASEQLTLQYEGQTLNDSYLEKTVGDTLTVETDAPQGTAVSWKSSDAKVISVNAKTGLIRVKRNGYAVITARLKDRKASFTLVAPKVKINGISHSDDLTITKGRSTYAGNVTDPDYPIIYKSSNPKVATISKKGLVKAIKPGTAIITSTSAIDPRVSNHYTVTVRENALYWDMPDPSTLGDGIHFSPKRLYFSGSFMVCDNYVFNNTSETVRAVGPAYITLSLYEDYVGFWEKYVKNLTLKAPIAPGGTGVYTFKLPKSYVFRTSSDRVAGKLDLPKQNFGVKIEEKIA